MRELRRIIILSGLVWIMLLGCDEDGSSPAGPGGGGDASATIEGNYLVGPNGPSMQEVRMRISSAEYDSSVAVGFSRYKTRYYSLDQYQLTGVPPDSYTFTPDLSECLEYEQKQYVVLPVSRTVSIGSGVNQIDPFFVFSREDSTRYAEEGLCRIGGLIYYESIYGDTTGSKEGVILQFMSPDGSVIDSLVTRYDWYRTVNDLSQGTNTIIPDHEYYTFDPPSMTVQADDIIAVANFKAVYSGPEPYTISFSVFSEEDFGSYYISFARKVDEDRYYPSLRYSISKSAPEMADGSITTPPQLPGTYRVNISYSTWEFSQIVEITDHDIDLGDIEFEYVGPLYYHVTGSAADASGVGIPGVKVSLDGRPLDGLNPITWPVTTDETGAFRFGGADGFETVESISLTITPEKSGWVFSPPFAVVTYEFDRSEEYSDFAVPDFIGTPLDISPYFPLESGASWTYTHSIDGVSSDTVTVTAGPSFDAGGQAYIPLSGSMFREWAGFRAGGAKVYAWNGTDAIIYAALDETSWDMGEVGGYTASGTRLASEDVTVPAGTFIDCEVIEIAVIFGETTTETTTLWLAENVGPVKMEFTTISGGNLIGRITDELTAYSLP